MRRNCSAAISSRDAISIGLRSFLSGAKSAARLLMRLNLPLLRVPVLFEIADQRGREMAIGLLACVHRHVAAEGVERFFGDAKGAPVARRADHAGACEIAHDAIE